MIIVETFEGPRPGVLRRRAGSGLTAHDPPPGSRRAPSIAFASGAEPECERHTRARLPIPPRPGPAPRSHALSRSKTADPAASPEDNERRQPPTPRPPTVRDHEIAIGALADGSPISPRFPPWEAFGRRPQAPAPPSQRAGVRNPSPERSSNPSRRCWAWNRRHAVLVAPQRCKRCTVCAQERNVVIDRLGRLSQGPQLPSSACFSASFQISISKLAVGRGRPDTRGIDTRGIEHL